MARLESTERADLPNSAFAYVDSRGRRRLPIHDEAHVRNALARFSQVKFEDEEARERARRKLLNAAKKHGIVPVGFITGQFRSERVIGELRANEPKPLPSGFVTLLMTDLVDSRWNGKIGILIANAANKPQKISVCSPGESDLPAWYNAVMSKE